MAFFNVFDGRPPERHTGSSLTLRVTFARRHARSIAIEPRDITGFACAMVLACCAAIASAQNPPIQLPTPNRAGGRPLMQVLQDRRSQREFRREPLPMQILSNLLWAGFGINRPDGRRTAPSASNRQEIDIYVAMPTGFYLYDAKAHRLQLVVPGDLRAATGTQPFAGDAALDLVYVADFAKMSGGSADDRLMYAGADAGVIAENVYLFCASERLATVVRASVDRAALALRVGLRPDQRIILAQSVGYPASP
jgi:nitroreductase